MRGRAHVRRMFSAAARAQPLAPALKQPCPQQWRQQQQQLCVLYSVRSHASAERPPSNPPHALLDPQDAAA